MRPTPVPALHEGDRAAAGIALLAAFVWATYYAFVLLLDARVSPLALLVYPFLLGGGAYALATLPAGGGRRLLTLLGEPAQWGRALLLLGIQVSLLTVTLEANAVDASLLALVGDVAGTPILVAVLFGEGRDRIRSPGFLAGLLLSGAGATLTILAGGVLDGLHGPALYAAPLVPVFVAGFFVWTARAGRQEPVGPLAAQAAILAGLLALPATLFLAPPLGRLSVPGPVPALALVGTGVGSFCLGPYLYFRAIRSAGILLPALLMATIPVFTLALAAALSGRLPAPLGLLGVPVALLGALLAIEGSVGRPGADRSAVPAPSPAALQEDPEGSGGGGGGSS